MSGGTTGRLLYTTSDPMARGIGNITVLAITAVLLTAAIYEGGLGLLQLLGMEPSGNRLYPFTGTFYNPGPFACYLALSLPWALYTISNEKLVISNFFKSSTISNCQLILSWIVVGLDAVLLPASMSRTAWCAAVVGSVIALFGSKVILFGRSLKDVCTKKSLLPHRPSPLTLHS